MSDDTIKSRFQSLCRLFSSGNIDDDSHRFIQHNKKTWRPWRIDNPDSIVICYFHSIAQTIISNSYFLQLLAEKHNAEIVAFSPLRKNHREIDYSGSLAQVYRSFNTSRFIEVSLSESQQVRARNITQDIMKSLRTKQDLFDLRVLDIHVGIDIYESYLREYLRPTVNLDDNRLSDTIHRGVETTIFWSDFLINNKISAVLVFQDYGVAEDILCRIAYKNSIPVYLADCLRLRLADRPHTDSAHFIRYHEIFSHFKPENKEKALRLAKQQMARRFSGEPGVDMSYSSTSAFNNKVNKLRVLEQSNKIKVLIATHCFFDNPHGYGGMLFLDFYEWLCFLGKVSEKTDYDWYLKTHPDPLPGTGDILFDILAQYPKIKIIPADTSVHQLVKEGIQFALTIYGTVGHEYPILGVQVINAGHNPHIAYDFNWHPKTIEEYEHYLKNLGSLCKPVNLDDIYEFYYMEHYYRLVDDLVFRSHRKFEEDIGVSQSCEPVAYSYFLDQFSKNKHEEILSNMRRFINSGVRNYFEIRPHLDFD